MPNLRRFIIRTINNGHVSRTLAPQHEAIVEEMAHRARAREELRRRIVRRLLETGLLRQSESHISTLPPATVHGSRKVDFVSEGNFDDACAICMEQMSSNSCLSRLQCARDVNHIFHRQCIDEWLGRGHITCPTCRSELHKELT
jgi:hypothetical protein